MKMKTITYKKCKSVPAAFWLFVLEETEFRGMDEDPKEVAKLEEIGEKYASVKAVYKETVTDLKGLINEIRVAQYAFMSTHNKLFMDTRGDISLHKSSDESDRNEFLQAARKFNDYKNNICKTYDLNKEEISDIDLFWELCEYRHW